MHSCSRWENPCRTANSRASQGKDHRLYSRDSTVIVAVSDVSALLPDETDADHLIFLPLASLNENGELKGRLAESWEHSPDYREWTYHLRPDVLWHDGVSVTAHDLKFTIDLLTHPDVLAYPYLSATVLNDSMLKIESSQVHGYQGDIVYYPKHLLEHLDPKDFWDWDFWKRPVGNGPYRFVRHLPETMIEFEANPDYYRGKPSIERVVLKFVGENVLTELLSGNVDVVSYANPAHIPQLAADPRFRVYITGPDYAGGLAIYWQHNNPLFRDPRVRRALTLAINRRELLQVLNLPENLPFSDGPITVRQYHRRQLPEPIEYNPAKARELLDAVGWHDQDGDGLRERDGQAFRFTAIAFKGSIVTTDKSAVYIQAQIREVGVHMDIKILDHAVLWERLGTGEFDAAFMIVQGAPHWYQKYFSADSPLGYNNPKVIKLIDQAIATADPNEQDRIYLELRRIFRVEQPITYLPLYWTYFVHRRIQGLITPFRADPLKIMEDLWLEDED